MYDGDYRLARVYGSLTKLFIQIENPVWFVKAEKNNTIPEELYYLYCMQMAFSHVTPLCLSSLSAIKYR